MYVAATGSGGDVRVTRRHARAWKSALAALDRLLRLTKIVVIEKKGLRKTSR